MEKELNPSPKLTEVYREEPVSVDMSTKVSYQPCENASVSEIPSPTASVDVNEKPCLDDSIMKVFLRIRPLQVLSPNKTKAFQQSTEKISWPKLKAGRGPEKKKKKTNKSCIQVCDTHSVTITQPRTLNGMKSEVYRGFSQVFSSDSSQEEVYAKAVSPLVEDFLCGKSGLLVASGPSGSGKTHTMFGTAREPGLVPLALRRIYHPSIANQEGPKRSFHLSIFEIHPDNGKTEKLSDLSPDGGEVQLQQSGLIKGLKELHIPDYMQAEAMIARALLRRNIGMANSNSQSSRSQCIIRIRCATDNIIEKAENEMNDSVLTFVDLAGAEREKKTGNQVTLTFQTPYMRDLLGCCCGIRLLESTFINKTSMVFGLCLKSLLEHQKNPKKPLRKHFQSSLLTRYLRDYLEGKKRMALIMTIRPAEKDYLDTSFLLRQASPCMEIKFLNKDDSSQNKRRYEEMFNAVSEQSKRIKSRCCTDSMDKVRVPSHASDTFEAKPRKVSVSKMNGEITFKTINADSGKERDYKILSGFAKSIWTLLKQHNQKIKALEKHNIELEKEISDLKSSSCACKKGVTGLVVDSSSSEITSLSKDECKGMEKQVDICNNGYDCVEEAIHNEMIGELKDDSKVIEQAKTRYSSAEESEAVVSAFHEPKVEYCESELCKTEAKHPVNDCGVILDVPTDLKPKGGNMELEPESHTCVPSNVTELDKSSMCETEPKHSQHECCLPQNFQGGHLDTKETSSGNILEGSNEKVPNCSSDLSRTIVPKSDGQSTHKNRKQKKYANCDQGGNLNYASEAGKSLVPPENFSVKAKSKRRLMPASTVLLRHVNNLGFQDEQQGGIRGRSRVDDNRRTTNSSSLLRLLNSVAHQ